VNRILSIPFMGFLNVYIFFGVTAMTPFNSLYGIHGDPYLKKYKGIYLSIPFMGFRAYQLQGS